MQRINGGILSLALLISSILIVLNAVVSLILGVITSSYATGIINILETVIIIRIIISLVFSAIGLFIGYMIFRYSISLRTNFSSINWVTLIILSIVSFIFDSGYVIGALLALGVGIVGYMTQNNIFDFNNLYSGALGTRICPRCGYVNRGNANFCSSCGEPFIKH